MAAPAQAQTIDLDWVDAIESYCYTVDYNTTAEIVVAVFPSLYGHGITNSNGKEINDIVQLGVHILNDEPLEVNGGTQTGIGKKGQDNGVLVLVALEEQQWRIEVGYGLEGDITDIEANLIAQNYLVPAFRDGDYGAGVYDSVVALGDQIPPAAKPDSLHERGVYYYESTKEPQPSQTAFWLINLYGMPLWLIILLAIIGVAAPVFGAKTRGGRSGGGGAGGKW